MAKFNVGDKIRLEHINFVPSLHRHYDAVGEIVEIRRYCRRLLHDIDTHYVIKWNCYKIPHIYMIWEVDRECVKIT